MAKILDKLRASRSRKILRVRLKADQLAQEIRYLEENLPKEKQRRLEQSTAAAKARLSAPITACEAADAKLAKKLQKYDIRQYMCHRAVNHGAAKAIFKAVRAGKSYEQALQTQQQKQEKLRSKRSAYIAKLEQQKEAYLQKNPQAGADRETLEKAYNDLYAQQDKLLTERYHKKLADSKQKLGKKLAATEAKLERAKAANKNNLTLPEDVVLRVEGLKMYFGGLKAVDDLSFDVKKGEIFGLIGPNGAGKTTVFNCITRFYDATGGNMHFVNKQGEVIDLRDFPVHDVILQGIVRTFQNVEVIREVSVLDNLLIAGHRQYGSSLAAQALHLPILRKEEKLIRDRAMKVLEFMDLTAYKDWYAFGLPYGVLKRIEIARTLMCNPQLIILDEPAAGLNDTETAELAQLIRRIQKEFDCTILLVEHDMGLVMDICDTVCAISFGKLLAIGTTAEVQADKTVQAAYLGTSEEG